MRKARDGAAFLTRVALFAYGGAVTLSPVFFHRHYLLVTFPLMYLWLGTLGARGRSHRAGFAALGALWVAQASLSAAFLHYIHVNGGAPAGDYGRSYRAQSR